MSQRKILSFIVYACTKYLILELKVEMLNQFTNDRDGKSAIVDQLLLEFLPYPGQENLKIWSAE